MDKYIEIPAHSIPHYCLSYVKTEAPIVIWRNGNIHLLSPLPGIIIWEDKSQDYPLEVAWDIAKETVNDMGWAAVQGANGTNVVIYPYNEDEVDSILYIAKELGGNVQQFYWDAVKRGFLLNGIANFGNEPYPKVRIDGVKDIESSSNDIWTADIDFLLEHPQFIIKRRMNIGEREVSIVARHTWPWYPKYIIDKITELQRDSDDVSERLILCSHFINAEMWVKLDQKSYEENTIVVTSWQYPSPLHEIVISGYR